MLPESIARFLDIEDIKKTTSKLEDVLTGDHFHYRNRSELLALISELVETVYIKGRLDERYHLIGPSKSLYEEPE